ncbi:hypothetical protein CVT24_006858 [Panaeolus cyanescens]|uniref:Jacalin-type lectin domain-containing protein n=1 Tax=Panaeolus cyanescens TaxID=181874 RepID=A0A409WC44_9AGAR|nr:hypothetical protein CVT24_006858 [Panaeolus cyanescens]
MISTAFVLLAAIHGAVAAQTTGSFSVLSYNVAGLPDIISSGNPSVNTPLIAARLGPYNIINVQEDFNYHAALYAGDKHAHRTPTSGGAGIGSGLNTLSDFEYVDFERVGWKDCNLNGGDCLTPKGFTFLRTRVSEGLWVDIYNLHTDAGSDSGDITARGKNFAQLTSYIASNSAGFPVVVMGDTNGRYTRSGDSETLRSFLSNTGTTDAWVSSIRKGSFPAAGSNALVCGAPFPAGTSQTDVDACEVVDKVFFRGGPTASFLSGTYSNDHYAFIDSAGLPLSDHYPILSRIDWRLSSSLRLGDTTGGPHGTTFTDITGILADSVPKITTITIRGANRLDAVSITSRTTSGSTVTSTRGGTGGTAVTLTLGTSERITSTVACSAQYNGRTRVFYLKVTTNQGRSIEAGKTTSSCVTNNVPSDAGSPGAWGLVGFWGRAGDEVDRLAPIWGAAY